MENDKCHSRGVKCNPNLQDVVVGAADALERGRVRHERPHAAHAHGRRTHLGELEGARARVQPLRVAGG